jgi:hypothetical protein
MKRLAIGALVVATLGLSSGIHSTVYACDRSGKAAATANILEAVPTVTVDVLVPLGQLKHVRFEHVSVVCNGQVTERDVTVCTEEKAGAVETARRTARAAATLGRAFVTTVSAVMSSLVDAAVSATSGLV